MLPGFSIITKSAARDFALCEKYMGGTTFPIPLFPDDTEVLTYKVVVPTDQENKQPLVILFANNLFELAKYHDKIMSYWQRYKQGTPHILIASFKLDERQVASLDIKFDKFYSLTSENGKNYNLPLLENFWQTVGKELNENDQAEVSQKTSSRIPSGCHLT